MRAPTVSRCFRACTSTSEGCWCQRSLEVIGDGGPETGQVLGREVPQGRVVGEFPTGPRRHERGEVGDGRSRDPIGLGRPKNSGTRSGRFMSLSYTVPPGR